MAIYKIFPKKDASIYTISQSMNTGLDEILDFSTKVLEGRGQTNRALIQFSSTEIVNTINNLVGSGTSIINGKSFSFTPSPAGTAGTYNNVPLNGLTNGAKNALMTVVVDGTGAITSATVTSTGSFYKIGEEVGIDAGKLGNSSVAVTGSTVLRYHDIIYGANLRVYEAVVSGLSQDATIEVYPISSSWNMGTGHFSDQPITTNGCSWVWKLS